MYFLVIDLKHYYKTIYLRGGISFLISLGVGLGCHFFMPIGLEHIKVKFVVDGAIFVITYLLCTYFITFKKDERQYYMEVLKRLLHIKKKATTPAVEKAAAEETKEEETKEEPQIVETKPKDGKEEN